MKVLKGFLTLLILLTLNAQAETLTGSCSGCSFRRECLTSDVEDHVQYKCRGKEFEILDMKFSYGKPHPSFCGPEGVLYPGSYKAEYRCLYN